MPSRATVSPEAALGGTQRPRRSGRGCFAGPRAPPDWSPSRPGTPAARRMASWTAGRTDRWTAQGPVLARRLVPSTCHGHGLLTWAVGGGAFAPRRHCHLHVCPGSSRRAARGLHPADPMLGHTVETEAPRGPVGRGVKVKRAWTGGGGLGPGSRTQPQEGCLPGPGGRAWVPNATPPTAPASCSVLETDAGAARRSVLDAQYRAAPVTPPTACPAARRSVAPAPAVPHSTRGQRNSRRCLATAAPVRLRAEAGHHLQRVRGPS